MTPEPESPWQASSVRAGELLAEQACGSSAEVHLSRTDLARWLGAAYQLGCEFAAAEIRKGGGA